MHRVYCDKCGKELPKKEEEEAYSDSLEFKSTEKIR